MITASRDSGRPTLLLVDDDDSIRNDYMLQIGEKFQIIPFADYASTMSYLSGHKPDVVLSDIDLTGDGSGRQGVNICDFARKNYGIPAFLMSSDYSMRSIAERNGLKFHLKGVESVADLVERISNAIGYHSN
ncbi:response regulator [Candidatus Woesearchaeota archaeon]|nr:MAG: response regulator [Candidatus Woesearchaeota archaeon]